MIDEHGQAIEQTLAPETEVALEASRRLPLLLVAIALTVGFVVCWRIIMHRRQAAVPVEWMPYRPNSNTSGEATHP